MSEASPESALALRKGILDHDTWDESPLELAGFTREGFVAIDGGDVEPNQLPADVLARLGVKEADPDDRSRYELVLGRRVNRRIGTLSSLYATWQEGQEWDPSYAYDDYGHDAAFIRVARLGVNALICAWYFVSAEESHEPDQSPLCDARVEIDDRMPFRQLTIDVGNKGGSLVEMARAIGIDPMTGELDPDRPEVSSNTDFRTRLANELGEPLSEAELAELNQDEGIAAEMQAAEAELHPLSTVEILGLAALVGSVQTSHQF